jgi:hypothetical protein
MSSPRWLPIRYREFYDVPRMFVIETGADTFLFDCSFDADADDYPASYAVYLLPKAIRESIGEMRDWRPLPEQGRHIGAVAVTDVTFDPTKRQFVDGDILARLQDFPKGASGPATK